LPAQVIGGVSSFRPQTEAGPARIRGDRGPNDVQPIRRCW